MSVHSAIYAGTVVHRRYRPVYHAFRYRLFLLYLDLAELDTVFRHRWLWSVERPNLASFRRADHLGPSEQPLDASVRDLVEVRTGRRPAGAIRLLTHLRYFGYCMNPVSFYYCWDPADAHLETIVAEVSNTPWGERHCYVLDAAGQKDTGRRHHFRFPKDFHVSPFMGMEDTYDWRFTEPGTRLAVVMRNEGGEGCHFEAAMGLRRRPLDGSNLARVLARHPFMTGRVVAGIYAQAFRLWRKGAHFHPHPKWARSEGK
ncbi:DUF1365 domain-containing protein [Thiohalorhabdus methylotrophus]|uniref:DUF1365 domain-containing protein n=1 Tax=Thiohalorhabdus methylotrophus TaxID=3242694 RepID=A0ABV4TUJ1_9GAMM